MKKMNKMRKKKLQKKTVSELIFRRSQHFEGLLKQLRAIFIKFGCLRLLDLGTASDVE